MNSIAAHNQRNVGGLPLHEAAYHGRTAVVDYLLRSGSPIDAVDLRGNTAISHSAGNGHLSTVRLFISRGANIALTDPPPALADGEPEGCAYTPIELASLGGFTDVVRALLDAGSPMDTLTDPDGHTCLMSCSFHGNVDLSLMLIHHATDPSEFIRRQDVSGLSACHYALMRSEKPLLRALLECGANPNERSQGDPLLNIAMEAHVPDLDIVRILLSAGADVHGKDPSETTALHVAACKDCLDICLELVGRGANPHARNNIGMTPLTMYGTWAEAMDAPERVLSSEKKQQRRKALEDARKSYLDALALRARREANWRRRRAVVLWNVAWFRGTEVLPEQTGVLHLLRDVHDIEIGLFDRVVEYL